VKEGQHFLTKVESDKLSSDEEIAFFTQVFPTLDKDNSGTLDADELFGHIYSPDIVPLENAGPVHVSVDSVLLPKDSVQEFIENHSSSGSLTLDEWLAAGPAASSGGNRVAASKENRVATKKTTKSASCTVQNLISVPSTCSRTDWVDNCEDVCTENCNSCRMAHPNSSAVARTSQESEFDWSAEFFSQREASASLFPGSRRCCYVRCELRHKLHVDVRQ
jgi:hypothetical protein